MMLRRCNKSKIKFVCALFDREAYFEAAKINKALQLLCLCHKNLFARCLMGLILFLLLRLPVMPQYGPKRRWF